MPYFTALLGRSRASSQWAGHWHGNCYYKGMESDTIRECDLAGSAAFARLQAVAYAYAWGERDDEEGRKALELLQSDDFQGENDPRLCAGL